MTKNQKSNNTNYSIPSVTVKIKKRENSTAGLLQTNGFKIFIFAKHP